MPRSRTPVFENLTINRGACAMEAADAEALAVRIKLHLYRGSIEQARETLEAGWRVHVAENQELPTGRALLDQPVSRVLNDIRVLNMLDKEGITTVAQFLRCTLGDFLAVPNMGPITARRLMNLREELISKASA